MIIVAVIAILLSFAKVADVVAKLIYGNKSGAEQSTLSQKIQSYAKTAVAVSLGLFLISTGAAALAVPVVGVAMIVVGVVLVAYALWPFFTRSSSANG